MHAHRSSSDHLPPTTESMREEDVRRMLAAREKPAPRRPRSIRGFLVRLAIMFTVYTLSIGPLYWKWYGAKIGLGSPIYLAFYRPLELLAKWIPPFGHFLNWYVSLWIYW